MELCAKHPGIILYCAQTMRRRYIVTSLSLIGWAHTQNDPLTSQELCTWFQLCCGLVHAGPVGQSHCILKCCLWNKKWRPFCRGLHVLIWCSATHKVWMHCDSSIQCWPGLWGWDLPMGNSPQARINSTVCNVYNILCLLNHHAKFIMQIAGPSPGIILWVGPANERRCYIVTSSFIGWAHTQNDPCITHQS